MSGRMWVIGKHWYSSQAHCGHFRRSCSAASSSISFPQSMHTYLPGPTFCPAFAFSGSLITKFNYGCGNYISLLFFPSKAGKIEKSGLKCRNLKRHATPKLYGNRLGIILSWVPGLLLFSAVPSSRETQQNFSMRRYGEQLMLDAQLKRSRLPPSILGHAARFFSAESMRLVP